MQSPWYLYMQSPSQKLAQCLALLQRSSEMPLTHREPLQKILGDLLSKITPANKHGEIDTGNPIGQEIW